MMSETTNASGTLTRTRRPSDTPHPHYFNSFQNYCSGPKAKTVSSASNKDYSPIPDVFKTRADGILDHINRLLVERTAHITQITSVLPREFFEQDREIDSQKYLIDRAMFKTMTEAKVINWVPSLRKLYPVRTSGNGNCLLHAVLIGMVGVHDFALHLRDRLRQFMTKYTEILKGNWKTERLKTDKMYGIQSEESKFDSEWEELCDLVRYDNSEDGQTASNLQFLEAVHIFSLSNMLARPIIILSEEVVRNKHGEAISYNDLFGIYLPILIKKQECVPTPIVLAYDQSHFCPLLSNDLNLSTISDSYLPLYQSSEHIRKQTLLPIRFLGSNESIDDTSTLLNNYLRLKKLSYYPESNGPGEIILCAELGTKRLADENNFFLLYYEYITNFFEIQKKKLQEEEEEKRRREQEYHVQNQPAYEPNQRSLLKMDISSSSSPPPLPPPYSSTTIRSNDVKKPVIIERRSSYGEAVNNGTTYGSSNNGNRPMNQYSEPQKPLLIQSGPYNIDPYQNNNKQHPLPLSNWDSSTDEPIANGKIPNYTNTNARTSDSRLKQDQQSTSVRVPVRFQKFDAPANLIDFEQQTDKIRPCILCKNSFNDLSSTGLCSACDYKKKPPLPRHTVIRQSPPLIISPSTNLVDFEQRTDQIRPCLICKRHFNDVSFTKLCPNCIYQNNPSVTRHPGIRRPPPMNTYSSAHANSDFLTPYSSSPKIRGPLKIACSYCKVINMINHIQYGTIYHCSGCKMSLNIPRH